MNPRVAFVSLGCAKNLVDSEVLLGRLAQGGFDLCADPRRADVAVVNTCGFLAAAEKESMAAIESLVALKGKGRLRAVVAVGCLPQRYGHEFEKRLRGVDAVLGAASRDSIVETCAAVLNGGATSRVPSASAPCGIDRDRVRLTPRHTAYIRISEGCDHTCAFCVIPAIRGPFRSKPMEAVLAEARELVADGAKEINLIAQDTSSYGIDLYRRLALPELLRKLETVRDLRWIRLLYCYPTSVTDRLIDEVARNPKVVKYVDMPIQHTREKILRAMRRGVTEKSQKDLIRRWREKVPGIALRTTVLAGFPGETAKDFDGLLDDLRELRFERLGAFQYSREPGSRAAGLAGQVPAKMRAERHRRVMELQQEIAFARNRAQVGRTVSVLVETKSEGRTEADAPEVDAKIRLRGKAAIGDIVRARVTGWNGYDLAGEIERGPK